MSVWSPAVTLILDGYSKLLSLTEEEVCQIGTGVPIPKFQEQTLLALAQETERFLQRRKVVLEISGPLYVVGDIHGNILDLLRVLILSKPPPFSRFLFLGDYVDRGRFSVEVISLLFALQLAYPEHVYLLRGNHEIESINGVYGFKDEVMHQFDKGELYFNFNRAFDWLPIVAIINKKVFCVHGGLSPNISNIAQIYSIQRPLKTIDIDFISDLLWSDPCITNTQYYRSNRGTGVTFGENDVKEFLKKFGYTMVLRAHQCVASGIQKFGCTSLFTVFSSSNYDESLGNRAGILFVSAETKIQGYSLPPITQLDKSRTTFEVITPEKHIIEAPTSSEPLTLNMKMSEINKCPRSSLGVRIKVVTGSEIYFRPTRRAKSCLASALSSATSSTMSLPQIHPASF